jgi:hypothetical protein
MDYHHNNRGMGIFRRVGWVVALLPAACGSQSTTAPAPPHRAPAYVMSHDEFVAAVAPVLSKHGCDNASCHGGSTTLEFRLSPRDAKDLSFDFAQACRQVYPSNPAESPLLMKPLAEECGGNSHAGGAYFYSFEDPDYVAMLTWIEKGEYR